MAFNTNTPRVSYIATAGQTVFPFTFKIFTNTNLTVYKNSIALVLSTNYTVTINGDSGGEVTLLVGASLSDEIVIVRSLPITREFDYQDNGDFFADTVDNDQDYQTYLVQDVDAKFDRTFKLPEAISGTINPELPLPLNDAYIRWNSDSTAIINDTTIPSAVLLAKDWANKAEDSVVADGEYSAKHYALKAEDEKLEATTQATIATTKASEASASASQALGYRNEAEGFRDEAEAFADSINPSSFVNKIGNETIEGIKTFTSSPLVPTPINNSDAVNKEYVDSGAGATFVANDSRAKTALNATGDAPIYACRAWVNFNGTGTVAIRASGNVSSITDNGVGDYTVNFTTAMPDVNYSLSGSSTGTSWGYLAESGSSTAHLTSSCRVVSSNTTGSAIVDPTIATVSFFR